jgi:peroxiredoxin
MNRRIRFRHRPVAALAAVVFVALAGVACSASADVAVGAPAPAFSLKNVDGQTVSLADFKGKPVVLEWINPNCPFSRRHAEARTMSTTAAKHPEAVWLAINSTAAGHADYLTPDKHKAYNEKNGISYAVLYDTSGAVGQAYGAKTTPHMFVIDKSGVVAYNGAIDEGAMGGGKGNYVDAALAALAAGKSPDPSTTKPYGCSVKY